MILGAREALFRRRDFFLVWGVFLLFDLGFSRSMSGLLFWEWQVRRWRKSEMRRTCLSLFGLLISRRLTCEGLEKMIRLLRAVYGVNGPTGYDGLGTRLELGA
jgi:hypothetical protein